MNAETIDDRLLRFFKKELSKEGAYLLPLRLFIGMGWLRAFAEKVADPGWHDGTVLAAFLQERLAGDHVVFPFYRALIADVFLPNARDEERLAHADQHSATFCRARYGRVLRPRYEELWEESARQGMHVEEEVHPPGGRGRPGFGGGSARVRLRGRR